MKKKGMFLTSILLCVAMIMTNFAGLGNSIAKVKADQEYEISFCVNDNSIGEVRGGIIFQENEGNYILKTDPVPRINGVEGDRVLLSVRYKDYKDEIYKIKEWKITPESGSIEEKNGRYIYTIGTENVEIQAIFEEKDSYTVSMEDWIYGKGEKRPTYIDENGDTIPVEEVVYFVNETCNEGTYEEPKDETTPENSGAEDIGRAPIKPGKYYAKFMLFGGDNYKTEYVILPFCIRETVEITPNNIEIPYIPEGNTYPVAELFEIPENAGDRTYSIVSQSSEQGVGTGTLEEDNNLTITKCGKFEIKVTTAQTDKAVTGSAIAILTVNPAVFTDDTTSLTLEDEVYAYSGSLCSPELTVYYGETKLTAGIDYVIDTTISTLEAKDVGIYPVCIKGIGNYTGFLSTEWKIKDSTAPTISISGENDEDVYYGPVSITVSDDNLSLVTLIKDDEQQNIEINNGSATINITDLGEYTLVAFDEEENSKECNFTIAQKEISITGQNKDITYDASKPYDLSGLFTVSDNTLIPEYSIVEGSGTGSISESGLTITKTGTFKIKAIIAEGTYNTYAEDTAVLNVSKADRDISVTINDVTYGTPVNISVSSTINTGSCTILYTGKAPTVYESSSTAPIGAGTYTATVTYPATDLYNVVEESVDFEITPATLTVKANDLSKKVETDDPELTYTVDGLKYNDKAADVLTGKLARVSGETIGDYNIVKGDLTANQNYIISFTGATFTINEKDSYNINVEKSIEEAGTITGAGNYEEGSSVTLTATANPGYKFIEWQENNTKVGDNNNYSFTITKNTTIKAVFAEKNTTALSITVNPQWTYGDSSEGKITFSGNTESGTETIVYYIDSDYTTKTNATNSGAGVEGGIPKFANTYYVKYSVGETVNYKAATTQTSFIINGKPISNCTLSLDHTSFDYVVGTTSYSPLLTVKDGETSLNEGTDYDIVTNESTTSANKVGSYTIKVNGKGNYAGTSSINWTVNDITAPEITGVANKSTNYGPVTFNVSDDYLSSVTIQEANDAQATTINVINGTSASGTKTELGSYIVTATDQAGNVSTCSFTIAQEDITITAKTATEDTSITYAPNATFDVSSLFTILGNAGTATYSIVPDETATAGAGSLGLDGKSLTVTKAGTITIKVTTAGSTYIVSAEATAVLKVLKAEGNITVTINNVTYGTPVNPEVSSTTYTENYSIVYTGKGQTTYAESNTAPTGAGTYTATVTYPENDLYKVAKKNVDFEINKATLTITANNISKKIETIDPELTYSVSGFQYNDNKGNVLNGLLAREEGETAGTYAIGQGNLTANNNYTILFTGAIFTINPKEVFGVTVVLSNENAGTITGAGNYIEGSTVILKADANSGYKFIGWQENGTTVSTDTEYSFVIFENRNVNAVFEEKENLNLIISIAKWIYDDSNEGKVTISGNDGNGEATLVYFINSDFSTKTNTANSGAVAEGGIPKYAGTYYVRVSVTETSEYKSGVYEKSFEIEKKTISDNMIYLDKSSFEYIENKTYEPNISVKSGNTQLYQDTDYEIVTTESTKRSNAVGVYTIKVKGIGNYTGTASVNWVISKDDNTVPVITGVTNNGVYVDNVKVTAKDDNLNYVIIKKNDDNEISYTVENESISIDITEDGSYIVKARDTAGNETVYGFKIIKTPNIKSKDTKITYTPGTYDVSSLFEIPHNAGEPSFSVIDGEEAGTGAGTILGKELTITKAGTIKISVNTIATDTAAPGSAIAILTVDKANGDANIEIQDVVYGSEINPAFNSTTNTGNLQITYMGRGETTYNSSSIAPTEVGSYTVTVSYPENELFNAAVDSKDFDILKADLNIVADNIFKKVGEEDPELTYTVSGLKNNDLLTDVISGEIARETGENANTYTIIQGSLNLKNNNYNLIFTEGTFTISSKDIFTVSIEKFTENAGTVQGYGKYEEGTTVTLTAKANSGYKFAGWKENDKIVEYTNEYTFDITSDRNFEAVFVEKKEPTIKINVATWTYGDNSDNKVTYTVNEGIDTITVVYYTDAERTVKTNINNGAVTEGGAPRNVGTYFVEVTVTETKEYKSGSAQQSFTIDPISTNEVVNGNETVVQPINVTGIGFDKTDTVLYNLIETRKTTSLTANLYPENADNKGIKWTVSDETIVSISSSKSDSGNSITLTALKPGEVTITASSVENSKITITINVEVKDILYNAKVKWNVGYPSAFTKGTAAPELEYTITYTSVTTNETRTSDPVKITATSNNNFSAGSADKEVTFTATADLSGYYVDKEGNIPAENVVLTKDYAFKDSKDESTGGGSKSGSSESEPEGNIAYNLFYDCEIIIPIPDGVDPTKGSGKWTSFYKVESDGKVTVIGDRKKAASAANSLITMPVFDGETQVGEYSYQLPVSYVKPKLKLSSTRATIKKDGGEQTVSTVVLEKKSNGMFEPIDVSAQKEGVAYYTATKGTATVEEGDNAGELFITASDATKGKIAIQLDNWTDKVELAFSVSAVNKDVLTVSAKSKVMNVAGGDDAAVTILLNNKEIESDSNVTVTMPKGFDQSGIEVEGIEEGKVTSSELKFSYKDGATVKKGNYLFKFACGKAKVNFKLTVSDAALAEKAVSLKVKTKLDLVSGQKMVIEPTLKGINGEISDIALDAANAELFDIEYNDELNQIYISAKDITKVNSTTKYTFVISLTVGGKECTATLKNQKLQAKNPAVKIAKLTLPKAQASTADAAVNVSATYKLGGKTFSVAPAGVKFTKGTAVEDEEGWFIDSKTNAKVHYNAEEQVIEVKAGAIAIKSGSIAVEVSFAGSTKAVKKSLSIKVK